MENFDSKKELELGCICYCKGDPIGAREHWLNVPQSGNDGNYGWAQLWLGVSYITEDNIVKARKHWLNIPKDDDVPYCKAQFVLGLSYYEDDDIWQARAHWKNVPRREDDYSQAQFFLGYSFYNEGDIEQAREYWKSISRRKDNNNIYGQAQFSLGSSYYRDGDIEHAREHWKNVPRMDDDIYDRAQLWLGISSDREGDVDQAYKHWKNVLQRKNDNDTYDRIQFNLGNLYNEKGDIKQARDCWLNVLKRDDDITYDWAQFNLGNSFYDEKDIKQAQEYWKNVRQREDNNNTYGQAQLWLGISCNEEGDIEHARDYWRNVPIEDYGNYNLAQFFLGISYYPKNDKSSFRAYWTNVLNVQCSFQKGEYNNSLTIYNAQKIIDYFKDKESNKESVFSIYENIQSIQNHTNNILKKLYINKKEVCEKNVAHYTRADIARIIIRSGYFQLGVSNHMNDSLEGKILLGLFDISMRQNNDLLAFLTSFTFNENSLNQFRLYGKEDNKDGTGVSLVIQNNFFNPKFDPEDSSDFINMSFKVMSIKGLQINRSKTIKENITEKKEDTNKDIRLSEKLPLFRCIYIDPKTNYVSVASKSKASFYDLMKNEENIQGLWEDYSKKINDLSKSLDDELKEIKGNIEAIKNLINEIGSENSEAIYEAIGTTLLPLIYLTKHVAFEEEAECRIFYITPLTNNLIKSSEKERRVYVEYSTKITALDSDNKIYLEKIYLGPKADSKMELILKKDWIDSLDLKSDQHADIPKIEKSTLPLA